MEEKHGKRQRRRKRGRERMVEIRKENWGLVERRNPWRRELGIEENEGVKNRKGEVSRDGGAIGGCGWKMTQLDWGISRKADRFGRWIY